MPSFPLLLSVEVTPTVLMTALMIAVARIGDVSLGVLRQRMILNERRALAWIIGFTEAMVWVFAVSKVVTDLDNLVYAVFYSLGFATGTFVGVTIERKIAIGEQVVRVFTHHGRKMARVLRAEGYRVTEIEGMGRDGPLQILFIQLTRKRARDLTGRCRELDDQCYYILDDIRTSSVALRGGIRPGFIRK